MYTEYWGLTKHPFDNVPDPEMYFDMHQSVDDAVSEVLFAIEEGDECLAVVVGQVGVGKTMCLRIVLDSLDHEKYRIAFVTNPDMTFTQLLREIIGQLEGKQCEESRKDRLLEMFNKLLFETNDKGKRVVIFIDEGNVIKSYNLESLRLLTNMQDDKQNLLTIVLAGQPELGKRLEDPRRANLFQRIGVYCKIHGLDSLEMMRDYIEHRLERAGNKGRRIFSDDAYKALWKNSDNGTPRIINKVCKLSLKAAETNQMKEITSEVVNGIAGRFMRSYRNQRRTAPAPLIPDVNESEEEDVKDLPDKAPAPKEQATPRKDLPAGAVAVKAETPPRKTSPAQAAEVRTETSAKKDSPVETTTRVTEPSKEARTSQEIPNVKISQPSPSGDLTKDLSAKAPSTPEKTPTEETPKAQKAVVPPPRKTEPRSSPAKTQRTIRDNTPPIQQLPKKTVFTDPIGTRAASSTPSDGKPEKKALSAKEMEALASKMATEKIESLKNVTDPFGEWEKARTEILAKLQKEN